LKFGTDQFSTLIWKPPLLIPVGSIHPPLTNTLWETQFQLLIFGPISQQYFTNCLRRPWNGILCTATFMGWM